MGDSPEDKGWEKRFMTDVARVEELLALYTEMGFEVMALPWVSEKSGSCDVCMRGEAGRLRIIYTRRKVGRGECPREREERNGSQG